MAAAGGYVGPPDVPEDSVLVKFSEGGWLPAGPMQVRLHPDECLVDLTRTCKRPDHPTTTSDCTTKSWINPPRSNDDGD